MPSVAIAAASSGDNQILPAAPGKKYRVLGYTLVASAAVAIKWRSNTNDRSGSMALAANQDLTSRVQFDTASGEALNLNLGTAVAVGGHLEYQRMPN